MGTLQARARFTQGQVLQAKQLWASFDIRMGRLSARRQALLELIQQQEANNHPQHAVCTAPAMIEPAAELMANVRLQQEVLLHTMRALVYGICTPWQWGHFLAFNSPLPHRDHGPAAVPADALEASYQVLKWSGPDSNVARVNLSNLGYWIYCSTMQTL